MAKILIVEDERIINELIKRNMQLVGHDCQVAFDGDEALCMLHESEYDLMILDIMLPKMDGFEVMGEWNKTPTIFLTARESLSDRIKGFSLGADDYIVKPFEMQELVVRVEAVLRRSQKIADIFECENVTVDFKKRQVYLNSDAVDFTPKEYELLEILIRNRNIALSRQRLLELVWGYDFEGDSRTVDVHIQKLRKKLDWMERIKTVYKMGYRLEVGR